MKKIHYKNLGLPKTGTTWLWVQLMQHPDIDCKLPVSHKEYRHPSLEKYKMLYEKYDVSINLDTHMFLKGSTDMHYSASQLHEYTTHISMSFRNPYEVLNSLHNMEKRRNPNYKKPSSDYANLDLGKGLVDMESAFTAWKDCRLPMKFFFYDDLVADAKTYVEEICDFLGIRKFYDPRITPVFKTPITDPIVFDNKQVIDYINKQIEVTEQVTQRDLSHWKK